PGRAVARVSTLTSSFTHGTPQEAPMRSTSLQTAPADYQESLQQSALHFLRRHHDEHLVGEQELFSRAVEHLVVTHAVRQAMAENVVARAYGELKQGNAERFMDLSRSTGNMALLVDERTGHNYVVPV